MTRTLAVLTIAFALGGCARSGSVATPTPEPGAGARPLVRLLLVNDVYMADTLRDGTGGVARVAALRDSLERAGGGRVLFFLAGDVLSPSLLSKWYAGLQMVDAFNAARLDLATFGNHEFELSRDTLVDRVARSRFRWVSANCTEAAGTPFPGVRPWDTLTVNGVRVGVFGATLVGDYSRYVRCGDPDSAAARSVRDLRAASADLVIALTHQTHAADEALLAREPGIDVVLGGHEHEAHRFEVRGRHMVKADANARSAQLVTLQRGTSGWTQRTQLFDLRRGSANDPVVAAVAAAWTDTLVRRLGPEVVVATALEAIDGRDAVSRLGESPLGDLVTDAIRHTTGADVALLNSGALRLDDMLGPGPVTSYRIESIFLFRDETRVVTFPLRGARLRELLEHGVSDTGFGHGPFLQVSGVRFRFDRGRPTGARIVGDITRPDGRPIGADETVRTSFAVYPACGGGDGYVVPEAAAACADRAAAPRTVDTVLAYIRGPLGGRLVAPPTDRIIRIE